MDVTWGLFIWDDQKEAHNIRKHLIDFKTATMAFEDPERKIFSDAKHSQDEARMFCIGRVGERIVMVRYTRRMDVLRIIGAGYWRKGRKYKMKNKHRDPDMPIGKLTRMPDDLPSPAEIAKSMQLVRVTIVLSKPSIDFFKKQAQRYHTKYQRMMREVLDLYATRQELAGSA